MAIIEMQIPSPGESVTEVQISRWLKNDGDFIEKDEALCEIESDKATLTLNAETEGILKILIPAGEVVKVKTVVCSIDSSGKGTRQEPERAHEKPPAGNGGDAYAGKTPSPSAGKMMRENDLKEDQVKHTGKDGRITKGDVLDALEEKKKSGDAGPPTGEGRVRREKMSMLRKKISQRLVAVKNQTAMLTTFNEVDMSAVMELRKKYKEPFKEVHGVSLGFMSFFTRAVTIALEEFPAVNAMIDGEDIVYHDYSDIGIAVSAPKGLMVPVIRNAGTKNFAQIESTIAELASKAREGKITISEMTGGTFTITNGGVFGSMLSTPILNPPQSAILGMHNIVERPVAVNGKVEIRPVMYVALSYDHRIIDGRESVGFLVKVKQLLESPLSMAQKAGVSAGELLGIKQ